MIKTTPHITEEQEKRSTIKDIVWASVVVLGMLALLLHGLALMSWTEPKMEEIYKNKRMAKEIEVLQNQMQHYGALIESIKKYDLQRFENHKHHFWTGKVK